MKKPTKVLGKPIIGEPGEGCTQTFITIGNFDTREEAENCLKYLKTKFCRAMLSTKKCTQHNAPQTWSNVPLQDFTTDSDIDWSKSIKEIDMQLYKKYGLTINEIIFVEANIADME